MSLSDKASYSFEQVLSRELEAIASLRDDTTNHTDANVDPSRIDKGSSPYTTAHSRNLVGLAFSGGGIRSATFNLGVIQALAKKTPDHKAERRHSLLSRFDYLSTVSGGGYIGSWLSAWIHREATKTERVADASFVNEMSGRVTSHPCDEEQSTTGATWNELSGMTASPTNSGFPPLEHAAVRFLRRYSNYLVPKLGLSGDMLALVSIFIRNLVLLQLALISMLACLLLVPYVVSSVAQNIAFRVSTRLFGSTLPDVLLTAGIVLLLFILGVFGSQIANVPTRARRQPRGRGEAPDTYERTSRVDFTTAVGDASFRMRIVNSALVFGCVVACWLIVVSAPLIGSVAPLSSYLLLGVITYSIAWACGYGAYRFGIRRVGGQRKRLFRAPLKALHALVALIVSGLVFGGIAYGCAHLLSADWAGQPTHLHTLITAGPPVLLLAISFIVTIHIGTSGDLFSEMHREWWARIGGFVLFAILIWFVVFALVFYTPPLFRWLGNGGFAMLAAWVGASGAGALIASNASGGLAGSNQSTRSSWIKRVIMLLAPWLFLIGMAMLVAWGLNTLMVSMGDAAYWRGDLTLAEAIGLAATELSSISFVQSGVAFLVALAAFGFITIGLDINIFSAHAMYRNRLVRAYLGASLVEQRRPHPFTGFDTADDIPLSALDRQRPLPLVNATVNMTGGDDLAWQTRRAASFTLTPNFVGFSSKNSHGIDVGGYRVTRVFSSGQDPEKVPRTRVTSGESLQRHDRGLTLGTALAISGAAASPNMGYHTSPAIAALLTAFNMRLGYWAGNPAPTPSGQDAADWTAWWRKRPFWSGRPLFSELTGSATGSSDWVNLTDGGHFDNLGIYELIRRRCRLIVVTDAGCDPQHRFEDLANAIRKCWTDFGVHLYFPELDDVGLKEDGDRYAAKHGTMGVIEYSDVEGNDGHQYGLILYLKNSLTEKVVSNYVDIRQYAAEHSAFPHQTTGDQFFDENQFEAYRHLGYCVANRFRATLWGLFDPQTGRLNHARVRELAVSIRAAQAVREQVTDSTVEKRTQGVAHASTPSNQEKEDST
ncbi:MAG: patatin-like phospholipase family protein [Pseudomonadota bacterium]